MADKIRVTLTLEDSSVRLRAPGVDVWAPDRDVPSELKTLRAGLSWMRIRHAVGDDLPPSLSATPAQVGQLLAERFLPEAVTAGLARVIGGCRDAGQTAQIGIDCAPGWRDLPWEALPSPGTELPLALDPVVSLHRVHSRGTPRPALPGPLRILVAISSPGRDGGLDYESELRNVVQATTRARAEIRIVQFATTIEIRSGLTAFAPQVLHLCAHGIPGEIELEDERGDSRLINAATFVAEAVPNGSMPPLIVLSACHSNAATSSRQQTFAGQLIDHGAATVVGTETGITDRYATRIFARLYACLGASDLDVASALAMARREVDTELAGSADPRDKGLGLLEEWAAVTLLTNGDPLPLMDAAMFEQLPPVVAPAVLPGLAAGTFVGRRKALRDWTEALITTGLVLHGVAGVGKSALAAELLGRAAELSTDPIPVVLAEPGDDATSLRRRLTESRDRENVPPVLVLDGFDHALTVDRPDHCRVRDDDLAELLAELAADPAHGRLLITCRRPIALPGDAQETLAVRPVPPLLGAETLRLITALPGLRHREDDELAVILETLGGHPGGLHRLNELVTSDWNLGSALPEVVAELRRAAGADDLLSELDALEDAADVLVRASVYREPVRFTALRFLYTEFEPGVSYMPAVAQENITRILAEAGLPDFDGFPWELPKELRERLEPHRYVMQRPHSPPVPRIDLTGPLGVCVALGLMAVYGTDLNQKHLVHPWLAGRIDERRNDVSLLALAHRGAAEYYQHHQLVIEHDPPDGQYLVEHDPLDLLNVEKDLHDLTAAMHHLLAAGERDEADLLNNDILTMLHDCGRWDDEAKILTSLLDVTDGPPARRADHLGRLGAIAHGRGQVDEALGWYGKSLRLCRELAKGDPSTERLRALSAALKRIGDLCMEVGNPIDATGPYQEASGIDYSEWRPDRDDDVTMYEYAVSSRNIGDLVFDDDGPDLGMEDYAGAAGLLKTLLERDPGEIRYLRELARVVERQAAIAYTEGDVGLAHARYDAALKFAKDIPDDKRTTADQVAIGVLYNRLGDIALRAGDLKQARERFGESRWLHENLILGIRYRMWGDRFDAAIRRGLAGMHEGFGDLARRKGDLAAALIEYGIAVDLLEGVAEVEKDGKIVHGDLATVAAKLAAAASDQGDEELGVRALERAVSSRAALFRQRPGLPGVTHDLSEALERLAAAAAAAGLTEKALKNIDLSISLRDRNRIALDNDDVLYMTGRPADRIALNERVAAARLLRTWISGKAEPDRTEALALLEPLANAGRLTPRGERILAELRDWSADHRAGGADHRRGHTAVLRVIGWAAGRVAAAVLMARKARRAG